MWEQLGGKQQFRQAVYLQIIINNSALLPFPAISGFIVFVIFEPGRMQNLSIKFWNEDLEQSQNTEAETIPNANTTADTSMVWFFAEKELIKDKAPISLPISMSLPW